MKNRKNSPINSKRIFNVIVIIILLGLFSARVSKWFFDINGVLRLNDGWDLRGLWDFNNALLHRVNPYPIGFRGECFIPLDFNGQCNIPVNTPLFLVITTPLAALDWQNTKIAWLIVNFISAFAILGIIEFKLLPAPVRARRIALLLLLFFASGPVSSIIQIGQTSILIFFFALLGLIILPQNEFVAGILLGLALSKYSLVFLVILFLILDRHYIALLLSLLMQLIGLFMFSFLARTNFHIILGDYVKHFSLYINSITELNLHGRIYELLNDVRLAVSIDMIGLGLTFVAILLYVRRNRVRDLIIDKIILIPFLFIASLPFVYHRYYDGIVLILLVVPYYWDIITNEGHSSGFWLSKYSLKFVAIIVLIIFYYPRTSLLSSSHVVLQMIAFSIDTFTILLVWLLLLLRLLRFVNFPPHFKRVINGSQVDTNMGKT